MKDERLYMTFPIDMPRHPKFARLSVDAKWAFIEMNGEARVADNDGVFTVEDAEFLWSPAVLAELVGSHPTRPLLIRDGDRYILREYAKHQQTKADREALRAKRSEAGRKGGLAKSQALASQEPSEQWQTEAQSESQSQGLLLTTHSQSHQSDARANETDGQGSSGLDLGRIRTAVGKHLGILTVLSVDDLEAVAADLIARSPKKVRYPNAFIEGCDSESVRAAWDRVRSIRGQITESLGGAA